MGSQNKSDHNEMKSTTMVAIVGLIVASVADAQQLPIPSLPTGVSRGNPNAPIHLVEFLDYQCLHCKEAYPIVEQVLNYYGSDKIYYTAHTYPLWLHRQAYTVAQAAKMVALHAPQNYWSFHKFLFNNQDQFSNPTFFNQTGSALYKLLASWTPSFGVSQQLFYSEIDGNVIPGVVNGEMHYGTTNQVYQTPTFIINGFKAESLNQQSTFNDLKQLIDSLLA